MYKQLCDLGVKVGSQELKNAEIGVLRTARRAWKGGLQGRMCTYPYIGRTHFSGSALPRTDNTVPRAS